MTLLEIALAFITAFVIGTMTYLGCQAWFIITDWTADDSAELDNDEPPVRTIITGGNVEGEP